MDKAERIRAYYQELDEKQDDVIRKLELPESDDYSPSVEAAIIESTNIYEDTDAFREVTIGALKIAKEKGLTEYHFLDEDYVTLNASIGMGIGLSGGFIMDRTGNVYSVGEERPAFLTFLPYWDNMDMQYLDAEGNPLW